MATRRKTNHINTPNGTHLGQDRVNHANELRKWFCRLTPEERGRVLLVDDKNGNNILRKMFQTRKGKGEVLFYRGIAEDLDLPPQLKRKIGASLSGNDFFYLKINSLSTTCFYPEKFLITDKTLEDSVRLCDTREYLDTFTLTSNLFEDGKSFLKIMQIVTRGNFLSTPCRVSYDATTKSWIWEGPKWFEGMGYYSLGTWISHKIEKALWMRYWDSHRLDPRTKNYSLPYTFPNVLEGLLSKNYLIQFWKSHNTQERRKIVGSIGDIVRHVIFSSNDDSDKNKYKQGLDYPRLLSQLVEITTQERNLEVLFDDRDLAQNEKTFIEILYFSPLDRAGTTIDMILRRIGMSIHSAYTEKLSMDLIVGEEAEKIKQTAQAEAKKKRRKKKKDKVSKKKKEQQEKENKEKEQKEREEKERKERERMAQEHQRIRKSISSLIGDIISNAEQTIEQKRQKERADEEERRKLAASILSLEADGKENETVANPNSKTAASAHAKRKSKGRKKKKLQSSTDLIFETRAESKEVNGSAEEPAVEQITRISRTLYHRREEYIIRLHQEIEDYAAMTKTIIKTYYVPRVEAIIEKLHTIATTLWHNAHIKVYGSYATSLCIPSSDLDLVIMGANTSMPGGALRLLANSLSRRRWVQDIQLIDTAKVPIIKLTSSPECIRTDIAVNDDCIHAPFYFCSEGIAQHSGVAACELVKGYVKKLPVMTSLVLLLKQYLQERALNNSYTGGLSSYGLTLMVISYLQLFGAKKNMGLLLIDLLDYYGKKFDFNTTGISISNGGNHFPLEEGFRFPPAPIVIVDPFNPSHNIAAGSFAIYRVKAALEELHNVLNSGVSSSPVLSRVLVQQPTRNVDMSKFSLKVPPSQRKQALRC